MKQTVKETAKEFAKSVIDSFGRSGVPGSISDIKEFIALGFENGSEWRINSVWHSNNRTYKAQKTALVIFKNGKSKVYDNLTDLTIESLWGEVDRFAYIEDLLPNMED